ncbi:MAG: hypothetical protein E2O68_09015 [Deltaproteobacteria bacterium]|nr:MAG: hypothetical protein E2O68_09015 [Deltaproteobacteria bacterium]
MLKKILILLLLIGCSSSPYKEGADPYKGALSSAFNQIDGSKRGIASTRAIIGVDSRHLKSFRMLVFPAQISFNKKRELSDEEKIEYGNPIVFNFNTLLAGKCNLLKRLKRYNSNTFFGGRKFASSKMCFVIQGRRARPKKWGKVVTRLNRDDTLAIRIFIDESFRPFGKSIDYALDKGQKAYRTVNLKMDSQESLSSELSQFPIDLPNLLDPIIAQSIRYGAVRIPQDLFVISQIKSKVKRPICKSGQQIDFKDFLGTKVMVDFCKGNSWPTTIHTNNFFAILI